MFQKLFIISIVFSLTIMACNKEDQSPSISNSEKALALIEAIETGDPAALDYISDDQYIQHNLAFPDGKSGIASLLQGTATGFSVTNHRVFEEGDIVVTHNTYGGTWNNGVPQIAFDVFRFEDGLIVEHWDNLQDEVSASNTASGRSMVDGPTQVTDIEQTDANKKLVTDFVTNVLKGGQGNTITDYISTTQYDQHNPSVGDGLSGLNTALQYFANNNLLLQYDQVHHVHAAGNFVLTISEGLFGAGAGDHVAYYDLFRVEAGKIVEHWDVIETIPAMADWKNQNGKF
ncbi:MAG: nuclear transport factor 2 family protein [Aureispira sp.]